MKKKKIGVCTKKKTGDAEKEPYKGEQDSSREGVAAPTHRTFLCNQRNLKGEKA